MAVFEYDENGTVLWRYYLNIRSKVNPRIRLQRRGAGFTAKKQAQDTERKELLALVSEIARLETQGSTWGDIVARWELFHTHYSSDQNKYSLATIRDHVAMMNNWTGSWMSRVASELNRGDGRSVLSQVSELGKSKSFQKSLKSVVNVIYTWGIDEGHIVGAKVSPVHGIDLKGKRQEALPEILTHDQVRSLLREAKDRGHPWFPIWTVTVLTGVRNGEAYGLRKEDIQLVSDDEAERQQSLPPEQKHFGLIRLTRSYNTRFKKYGPLKGRYWRTVPVSSELYWVLRELKAMDFGGDEHGRYLLPRSTEWCRGEQAQVLRAFCKEVSLPSIRFHTLRACFATHLIARGIPSATVMKICGWRDLKTMERYIRLAGIDERGATEGLGFAPTEQGIMEKVVSMYEFRARSASGSEQAESSVAKVHL